MEPSVDQCGLQARRVLEANPGRCHRESPAACWSTNFIQRSGVLVPKLKQEGVCGGGGQGTISELRKPTPEPTVHFTQRQPSHAQPRGGRDVRTARCPAGGRTGMAVCVGPAKPGCPLSSVAAARGEGVASPPPRASAAPSVPCAPTSSPSARPGPAAGNSQKQPRGPVRPSQPRAPPGFCRLPERAEAGARMPPSSLPTSVRRLTARAS